MNDEELTANNATHATTQRGTNEVEQSERGIAETHGEEYPQSDSAYGVDEHARAEVGESENAEQVIPVELLQAIQVLQSANVSEQWSGLLPSPKHWNQYSAETQKKIIEWNDARITDESKRQDRLTDAEIEQAKTGQSLSVLTMLLFGILSFVAFIVTRSPYSWGLLTVPIVAYVSSLFAPIASKSSRDKHTAGKSE